MRVSAGFFVYGLSGKTLIQTLPPRLILRVIAIRAASIWRLLTQPFSSALIPKSPNCTDDWPLASPRRRPRWALRNFVFFGINMSGLLPRSRCALGLRLGLFRRRRRVGAAARLRVRHRRLRSRRLRRSRRCNGRLLDGVGLALLRRRRFPTAWRAPPLIGTPRAALARTAAANRAATLAVLLTAAAALARRTEPLGDAAAAARGVLVAQARLLAAAGDATVA